MARRGGNVVVGRRAAGLVLGLVLAAGVAPSSSALATSARHATTTPAPAAEVNLVGAYVERVYLDLFGRLPDPSGLATWTRAIESNQRPGDVALALTSSEEFRSRLISDAYGSYLGRAPDGDGLRFWLARMAEGRTIAQLGSAFLASEEYWLRSGAASAGWVTALYRDVLDRAAGPEEVAFWVGLTEGGMSRSDVALGFLLSTEELTTVVDGYYRWLLHRSIDPAGRMTWVGMLQAGLRDEEIIAGVIDSAEYWGLVLSASTFWVEPVGDAIAGAPIRVAIRSAGSADLTPRATLALDGDTGACGVGSCTTTVAGRHTLTATVDSRTEAVTVDVQPGAVASVAISPASLVIADGGSVEYTVAAEDAWRNPIPADSARLTAGGHGCDGLTCGPLAAGSYEVRAVLDGLTAAAVLTVSPPGPPSHSLLAWGHLPSGERFASPQPFGTRSDWTSVTNNFATYLAIRSDGTLWGWGSNACGEIPGSRQHDVSEPVQIGRSRWVAAEAGGRMAAGIQADGSLWLWGDRECDGFGDQPTPSPVRVGAAGGWSAVSAGYDHVVAVRSDRTLWSFGGNSYGQLGTGAAAPGPRTREPAQVGTDHDWSQVSASMYATLAIKSDGTLWAWGSNPYGRLGIGTTTAVSVPTRVGDASDWAAVSSGSGSTAGIRADGSLWTWGRTLVSGTGDVEPALRRLTPTQIGQGHTWTSVSSGYNGTVAIDSDGMAWSWGNNEYGRLGDGTDAPRQDPAPIVGSDGWSAAVMDMDSGFALVAAVP